MPDLSRPTDAAEPTIKESVVAQLLASVQNEKTWLQKHERLIIVVLVIAFGSWLGSKYLDNAAANAKSALVAQQQVSAAAASQAEMAAKGYQVAIEALSKQVTALDVAMTQRQTVLVKQQAQTSALPPDQLVTLWQGLIPGINKGSIVPTTNGYAVDPGPAIDTVNQLEEVPVLKANLADETNLAATTQSALTSCSGLVDKQKTEIAEDKKTCDAQTASLKADARKSKRNWFIGGLVTAATIFGYIVLH